METEAAPLPVRGLIGRGLLASDVGAFCIHYPVTTTSCSQLLGSYCPCPKLHPLLPMPLDTILPGTPIHSFYKDGVSSSPFGLKLIMQLMTLTDPAAFTS